MSDTALENNNTDSSNAPAADETTTSVNENDSTPLKSPSQRVVRLTTKDSNTSSSGNGAVILPTIKQRNPSEKRITRMNGVEEKESATDPSKQLATLNPRARKQKLMQMLQMYLPNHPINPSNPPPANGASVTKPRMPRTLSPVTYKTDSSIRNESPSPSRRQRSLSPNANSSTTVDRPDWNYDTHVYYDDRHYSLRYPPKTQKSPYTSSPKRTKKLGQTSDDDDRVQAVLQHIADEQAASQTGETAVSPTAKRERRRHKVDMQGSSFYASGYAHRPHSNEKSPFIKLYLALSEEHRSEESKDNDEGNSAQIQSPKSPTSDNNSNNPTSPKFMQDVAEHDTVYYSARVTSQTVLTCLIEHKPEHNEADNSITPHQFGIYVYNPQHEHEYNIMIPYNVLQQFFVHYAHLLEPSNRQQLLHLLLERLSFLVCYRIRRNNGKATKQLKLALNLDIQDVPVPEAADFIYEYSRTAQQRQAEADVDDEEVMLSMNELYAPLDLSTLTSNQNKNIPTVKLENK